ncbi:Phosphatidylinositol 4-kinase type 2-beta [Aphelenchoides fujianensis]|nr:Phosphatidylinositol 4-kinase type 2-beta [Aphelenchoides fujianensis]
MSIHAESDLSDADETRPLVPAEKKRVDVQKMSMSSAGSAASSDLDDTGVVDKYCSHMPDEYRRLVSKALKYIDKNPPTLISSGSSGSYFIHGEDNAKDSRRVQAGGRGAVRHQQPQMGQMVPERSSCPARSVGDVWSRIKYGYVSEAAAWMVDEFFGFHVVPQTAVVLMASKVFSYSRVQRYEARAKAADRRPLPESPQPLQLVSSLQEERSKGSFQTFVQDFMSPEDFCRLYPVDSLSDGERENLTAEIQKMFVLDYIIRNTDRLNANYLVKVVEQTVEEAIKSGDMQPDDEGVESLTISGSNAVAEIARSVGSQGTDAAASTIVDESVAMSEDEGRTAQANEEVGTSKRPDRIFHISCIDNGLAFPFQHPSGIRSYPFSWAKYFPYFANQPFVPELKQQVLNVLQDINAVKQLCESIRAQLAADKRYQKQRTIEAQLSVIRGQMYNLLKALEGNSTPAHLELQTPLYANKLKKKKKRRRGSRNRLNSDEVRITVDSDDDSDHPNVPRSPAVEAWRANYAIKKHVVNPYFSCC